MSVFLDDLLRTAARHEPTMPALHHGHDTWTHSEYAELVAGASGVIAAAAPAGGRVVLVGGNSPALLAGLLGAAQSGRIAVPINLRLDLEEQITLIGRSGPSAVFADVDRVEELAAALAISSPGVPVRPIDELGAGAPVAPAPDRHPDDPVWMIFTSGTTSAPKGVLLTHRSLTAATLNTALARPPADDEVYLFPFPLFHVAAYNVLVSLVRRRPVVLLERFDAGAVVEAADRHGVTAMSLAPTMMSLLLAHPQGARVLSGCRLAYGASAIPEGLLRRVLEAGAHPAQGYGMTELSGNAVFLGSAEHRRGLESEPRLLRAAGRPGPLIELRLADDSGQEVAAGEVGEIQIRGDQVSPGYWQDPDATAAARAEGGWFRTGDLGRLDEAGRLYVVDRAKDIIVTGGENVASREVEDAVSTHPLVESVAVIGLPDEHWGEVVTAVVVPRGPTPPTLEQIADHVRGRLAGFKRPRRLVITDALPVNGSGKVLKRHLRDAHS